MANIVITAANCVKVAGNTEIGTAGEAITAGTTCFMKSSDGKFWLADSDPTAVTGQTGINVVRGIALNSAAANQPLTLQTDGTITIGGTVTVGKAQYLGPTGDGGITETVADLASNDWVTVVGVATTAAIITLNFKQYACQIP